MRDRAYVKNIIKNNYIDVHNDFGGRYVIQRL